MAVSIGGFDADPSISALQREWWNDINISMLPPVNASSVPDIVPFNGDSTLLCYSFHGTTTSVHKLASSLEILHGYKEGSDIHFHFHWYPGDTGAGNIKFTLVYTWFNIGLVPPASTTVSAVVAAPGVAWEEHTTVFILSGAGKTIGSRLVFELQRNPADAADTYTGGVAVTDIGLHYLSDTDGSTGITTK